MQRSIIPRLLRAMRAAMRCGLTPQRSPVVSCNESRIRVSLFVVSERFSRGSQENRQRELGRARFMSLVRRVALDQVILCEYKETPLYRRISQPSERGPLMSNIVTRATVDGFLNLQRNGVESFCRCRRCCFPFSRTGAREVEIVPCTAGRAIPDTSSPLWRPIWEA